MLRALGPSAGGLRLMLTLEALLCGLFGGILGEVLGTSFGLAAARVIKDKVVLTVPVAIAAVVLGGGLAAVLASLGPTRHPGVGGGGERIRLNTMINWDD